MMTIEKKALMLGVRPWDIKRWLGIKDTTSSYKKKELDAVEEKAVESANTKYLYQKNRDKKTKKAKQEAFPDEERTEKNGWIDPIPDCLKWQEITEDGELIIM